MLTYYVRTCRGVSCSDVSLRKTNLTTIDTMMMYLLLLWEQKEKELYVLYSREPNQSNPLSHSSKLFPTSLHSFQKCNVLRRSQSALIKLILVSHNSVSTVRGFLGQGYTAGAARNLIVKPTNRTSGGGGPSDVINENKPDLLFWIRRLRPAFPPHFPYTTRYGKYLSQNGTVVLSGGF